jgi:bifunctional DNA-binding transcriptional regulator/antitoxin component of YhaV-PrlF toxin-antitoxin module
MGCAKLSLTTKAVAYYTKIVFYNITIIEMAAMSVKKAALKKIARGFQVTLPREFRERYNLTEGDYLEASEENGAVIYRPVVIDRKKLVAEMDEALTRLDKTDGEFTGVTEEEVIQIANEQIRKVRAEKKNGWQGSELTPPEDETRSGL